MIWCTMFNFVIPDLDACDSSGNTALHYAVENNCLESLSMLLASGANSSITNKDQIGPIHLATQLDRVSILEVGSLSL